jgi:hypothetical protein
MMTDVSVLIPARNEMWLAKTIESVLSHSEMDTEVIAVLDGAWADPPIPDNPRVQLIYHSESIGQRAAINEAARMSTAKYVMKLDAHCDVDQGFDRKLMQPYEDGELEGNVTTIPRMYNLHVFDWKCNSCGHQSYQGPVPKKCEKCGKSEGFERVVIWTPRWNRRADFARFDKNLHFQYWGACGKRPEADVDLAEVLCFVGACFFMPRERYWEIDGCDERHGSWGQQGVEMSCKSWLSGGRMIVNKRTWFSHLFRTQPGFGFPYHNPQSAVDKARQHSRWLWEGGNWEKAVHPLSWLLDRFYPVPEWHDEKATEKSKTAVPSAKPASAPAIHHRGDPSVGICYYTDNRLDDTKLARVVRQQIWNTGHEVVSVSLKPIEFGKNIVLAGRARGILTMFKQILAGLEAGTSEIVFLAEHDVIYHPSHFRFVPSKKDVYYYNENAWRLNSVDGQALFYYCKQTSGLCAYRELLVEHYRKRIAKVEQNAIDLLAKGEPVKNDGFSRHMGFEPGCHSYPRGVDNYKAERWLAPYPNLDVRHDKNLTPNRWKQEEFRNKDACQGWTLASEIPGWGRTKGRFVEFLNDIESGKLPLPEAT